MTGTKPTLSSLPRIAKTGPLIRNSGIRKWALEVYSQRETTSHCSHGSRWAVGFGFARKGSITLISSVVNAMATWLDISWPINHLDALCMILWICMIIKMGQVLSWQNRWNLMCKICSLVSPGMMLCFFLFSAWQWWTLVALSSFQFIVHDFLEALHTRTTPWHGMHWQRTMINSELVYSDSWKVKQVDAMYVYRNLFFIKLYFKFFYVCLILKKLINKKYLPVKWKFSLVFRKVFSWKIWAENTFWKLWKI
jgi:hypothetical protein